MEESDYRKRFFDRYVTSHVKFFEDISYQSFSLVARNLQKHISRFLPDDKNASILDIACGSGHVLHFLQSKGYHKAQGIDLSAEQLEMARGMRVKNIEQADMFEYLRKYTNHFDLIISFQIIEHLKKNEAIECLDLIYNALKPGGKILVATPNVTSFGGLHSAFGDFTHELVFTPRSIAQILRVCKFSNVKLYGMGPVASDLKSGVRTFLWGMLKGILKIWFIIEFGTGRSIWRYRPIFEGSILGVGEKIESSK